jgi:RNA polymerase sigma factor (sigma-70 family)
VSEPWATLYCQVWEELVRFLDRKVWDMERAQDLAQETFVRALRADPIPDSPRAWLFTVAANLARDEARTAIRRRERLRLVRAESEISDPNAAKDEELLARERRNRIRQALASLNDREREALLLCEAGLSYAEIAVSTGLSAGSVGTTLSRARRKLAAAWDALRGDEENGAAHR